MLGLDVLLSVANVIYLLSYSVRDILWLRILTVIGALLLLPFYYLQPEPLWAPIAWNLVFTAINLVWITKLLMERRPVDFSDDEMRLYQISLRSLRQRDAFKLFRVGTWTSAPSGTTVITQGLTVGSLMLIAEGSVSVEVDGQRVDTLGEGRFLGASAFFSRTTDYAATMTVKATEPTRMVSWSMTELESHFAHDLDLEVAIEASLGLELSRLLQSSRAQTLRPHLA
jgi:hypothetical protein